MNFNGWVRVDRSILELTMTGKLSNMEALVLLSLKLLADRNTGMGRINGPVLRTYLPGLTEDTAKRTLQSLEKKRYIYRKITRQSKLIYPYWVNGYDIRASSGKVRLLDLTQVFDSKDIRDLKYVTPEDAPEVAPEVAPETAPDKSPHKTLESKGVNHDRQNTLAPEVAPEMPPDSAPHTPHYNNNKQEQETRTMNNNPTVKELTVNCSVDSSVADSGVFEDVLSHVSEYPPAFVTPQVSEQTDKDSSAKPPRTQDTETNVSPHIAAAAGTAPATPWPPLRFKPRSSTDRTLVETLERAGMYLDKDSYTRESDTHAIVQFQERKKRLRVSEENQRAAAMESNEPDDY
jgi:hypothetical protein